jgi:lactose/L-arabinose transport system permease protein
MREDKIYLIKKNLKKFLMYTVLTAVVIISVFPFFWMLVGSTNVSADVTKGVMSFGGALKENWSSLSENNSVLRVFFNTMKVTVLSTAVSVLICAMAGYGFEKYRSRVKDIVYSCFLLAMMIPFAAIMIPLFKMMSSWNLLDSHIAVALPTLAMPFMVFFFRQNFMSFPTEVIESARIDGANEIRIFFTVVLPPMKSVMSAGIIYSFMKQWNNYLWPLIVIQSNEQKTFTLLLSSLSSAYFVDYGQLMLAIVLATLPILVMFLTMQKQFVNGITGSSK